MPTSNQAPFQATKSSLLLAAIRLQASASTQPYWALSRSPNCSTAAQSSAGKASPGCTDIPTLPPYKTTR